MIVKRLLQFNLFVSVVIAAAFILAPQFTLSIYGIQGGEALLVISRYFGTTHLSFALLLWLAFRAKEPRFLRTLVVSFFAGDLIGTAVLLMAQINGVMNSAGWGFVGLSLLFAIGYGYGALKKLPESW